MDEGAELRALRARAYGRDADIAGDEEALNRLRELENRAFPPPADIPPAFPAEPADAPEDHEAAVPDLVPDADEESDSDATAVALRPRAVWIAAAVAAVVVSAAVATAVTASARPTEPGVVDTIAVDPSGDWWEALGEQTEGSVLFLDYYGITFVRNEGWTPIDDQRCLLGVSTEMLSASGGDFGFSGLGMGCSAGAFPASVQFTVAAGSPDALKEHFAEGTSLKFTLRGDTVEVRSDR